MSKRVAFLVLGVVLLTAGCAQTPEIVTPETLAEAKALAAELDKPLLVNFFAAW